MSKLALPKNYPRKKMKRQLLPDKTKNGSSSQLYCGCCGRHQPPERISVMRCLSGHDLKRCGVYEYNLFDGIITEGWWIPPEGMKFDRLMGDKEDE